MAMRHLLLTLLVSAACCRGAEAPWFAFDALTEVPARFETQLAHTASWADGPDGHRALAVTVASFERDERACAFHWSLPRPAAPCTALRVWLQGSARTHRVELVLRTPAGAWAADVPVGPEWRPVTLSARNLTPWFGDHTGPLAVAQATEIRCCFGAWQGHTGGPHRVAIGPITAVDEPALAAAGPVSVVERPVVPLPPQPLTVDLLDQQRGQWHFDDALGQRLSLAGPVPAFAWPGAARGALKLAWLLCDPEFAEDLSHATLKVAAPARVTADAAWFRLDEPCLGATVLVPPVRDGQVRCELRDLTLGPAVTGDRYVSALYLCVGEQFCPLWLAPDQAAEGLNPRLLSARVGHVFSEGEPVTLMLSTSRTASDFAVEVTDYAGGARLWQGHVRLPAGDGLRQQSFTVPLARYGIFTVTATAQGLPAATLRVCRVPRPRAVAPDASTMGMNLFQQQIWWYAYQPELLARAGVHWIRPWLAWENTWRTQEPQPGQWDTRALDAALRRLERYGQRYQYILWSAPNWVAGDNSHGAPPVAKLAQWSAYVERLVARYRDRIRYWEVWNEPDLMWPEATRHGAEHYAAVLRATHGAAKRADPTCVLLGLSHAGYEEWLQRLGKLGVADTFDIATVHSYAPPGSFVQAVQRRRALLDQGGMAKRPLWVNEFGSPAYDFSAGYSTKFACSELRQAAHLPALYAQALSLDAQMKAYWFCSYDPRDCAHEDQWNWDGGIGVLYLGFLPKLGYAALAATAYELDGRACQGRHNLSADLHQIAFAGDVSVVWHDRPQVLPTLAATALGCRPEERVTVRDLFANVTATGPAGDLPLDLGHGPLFVEGSKQLSAIARCERLLDGLPASLSLVAGQTTALPVALPAGLRLTVSGPAALPVAAAQTGDALRLAVPAGAPRAAGTLRVALACPAGALGLLAPHTANRRLALTVGQSSNLIRDPGFSVGDTAEWTPQFSGDYAWDGDVGHGEPGSLRLAAGGDRRLVHWNITPVPGRDLHLRGWVRTEQLTACRVTLTVALFAGDRWLKSYCLATTDPSRTPAIDWPLVGQPARIPLGTQEWTLLSAVLPGSAIPAETRQLACHVDVRGGTGRLWLDDLDLWQP